MGARLTQTQSQTAAGSQASAEDYARTLQDGVDWLRFGPAIEAEFQHSHVLRLRSQARFWQLFQLVVGLIGIRVVLDGRGATGVPYSVLIGCVALHLAVSMTLAFVVFGRHYVTSYHRLAAILMPFRSIAFSIVVAAVIHAGGSGTAAMTVNLFGLLFFSGLLLRQALPAAVAMCVAFMVALTVFDVNTPLAAYSITSLLVVFGLAGFVAWDMQRAARTAFLEHGLTRVDATRDALTGLVNRRHFDSRLNTLWQAGEAARRPLTVILIDIDYFKSYNDNYGHQAGDEALRRISKALRAAARPDDLVARYGGEELALVATDTGEHEAEALAGRLRRAIETLGIPHQGAPETGTITVSIGGACIVPTPDRSAAGALQIADENLYSAKRQGRNRVVFRKDQYEMMKTGIFRKPVHEDPAG